SGWMGVSANVLRAGSFEHFSGGVAHVLNHGALVFAVRHVDLKDRNSKDIFDVGIELDKIVPARKDFAETRNLDAGARFENSFFVGFAEAGRCPVESDGGFPFVAKAAEEFFVWRSVRQ